MQRDPLRYCSSRFPLVIPGYAPRKHPETSRPVPPIASTFEHIGGSRLGPPIFVGCGSHKELPIISRPRNSQSPPARTFRAYRPHLLRQKKPMLIDADTLMIKTPQPTNIGGPSRDPPIC